MHWPMAIVLQNDFLNHSIYMVQKLIYKRKQYILGCVNEKSEMNVEDKTMVEEKAKV